MTDRNLKEKFETQLLTRREALEIIGGGVIAALLVACGDNAELKLTTPETPRYLHDNPIGLTNSDRSTFTNNSLELNDTGKNIFTSLQNSKNPWIQGVFTAFNKLERSGKALMVPLYSTNPSRTGPFSAAGPICTPSEGIIRVQAGINTDAVYNDIQGTKKALPTKAEYKVLITEEIIKQLTGIFLIENYIQRASVGSCPTADQVNSMISSLNGYPGNTQGFVNYGRTYSWLSTVVILDRIEGLDKSAMENIADLFQKYPQGNNSPELERTIEYYKAHMADFLQLKSTEEILKKADELGRKTDVQGQILRS